MPGTRTVTYVTDQLKMETGQTTWNRGALIARSTTEPQAGRLSTSNADEILGAYYAAMPANASSPFATDQLPEVALWGTGIPLLVQASATIVAGDRLTPSSITPGTVRTALEGEPIVARAITAITVGGAANLVMAELYPTTAGLVAGGFGTVAAGVTATEEVSGSFHKTTLTVNSTLPEIAGGAALAVFKALYTMPAGVIQILGSSMSMELDEVDGNITADTPDVGLGTTPASGAVAVLGGTAAFENILTGQTAADCNGTPTVANVATNLAIAAAASHVVYFNVADTWAASGEAACPISGTVTILWTKL